jgi:hypothetical protein
VTRLEEVALAAALPVGIAIGIVDAHAGEVQPAVALFLVAGAALGALAPRVSIPLGALLGLGVPIVGAWMRLRHLPLAYETNSYWGGFLALIPATLGALAGAWMRRVAARG